MPGTFNTYQSSPHSHEIHPNNAPAGAKSHIFRPPRTPSESSSVHLARSYGSLMSIESDRSIGASRKRSRTEYNNESCATPVPKTHGWSTGLNTSDVMETSLELESPAPFVSTKYELAGGLDTPSAFAETRREVEENQYFDTGFRRGFGDAGMDSRPHANLRYTITFRNIGSMFIADYLLVHSQRLWTTTISRHSTSWVVSLARS